MVKSFEEFLNDLRASLSLYDVISRKIRLNRKGREFWGCCPFHNEKTPSFAVNEDKGFYHCFGCGAHGDIIKFEMETQNLPFMDAVRNLADLAGLELPAQTDEQRSKMNLSNKIKEIQELACQFYEKDLWGSNGKLALEYLRDKRHLTDETIKTFRIGYASRDPKHLQLFLKNNGITEEELLYSGLFRKSQHNEDEVYTYFKDRILFPITDRRGMVIAFSGRIMGQGEPKYLNSPETEIFKKGSVVFGYAQAKNEAIALNKVYAVEGQLDMIRMYQEGIKNAVAPLGTALTEFQISAMWQIGDEITLCFDGDIAGKKAAVRGTHRAVPVLKPGKIINICMMPTGKDPDDILNEENGVQTLKEITGKTQNVFDTLWAEITDGKNLTSPEHQAHIESELERTFKEIKDPNIQKYYLQHLRNKLWETFKRGGGQQKLNGYKSKFNGKTSINTQNDSQPGFQIEPFKLIFAYMVLFPQLREQTLESVLHILPANNAFNNLINKLKSDNELTASDIASIETEVQLLKSRNIKSLTRAKEEVESSLNQVNLSQLKEDIEFIRKKFTETADPELWEKLKNMQNEYQRLKKGIDDLG